jgi:hypothetical protein
MIVAALHGLCFGTLYAPFWALIQGLDINGILIWIAYGFPADLLHAAGNFAGGALVIPLTELLLRLERRRA